MLKVYLQIKDLFLREALEELLPQAGIDVKHRENECEGVLYEPPYSGGPLPAVNLLNLPKPLQVLNLLSLLENLPYSQEITFSHFSLDLREKLLKNVKTKNIQRLTEKETQLLHFFHQHKGRELSKDKLLIEIWGYHPDVETHTLETHIYRLRQKLEEDPNAPQILLNGKEGYWIRE